MIFTLGGRLTQFLIAFLSVKLMTTFLTPTEVGKVALVTAGTAFFALFLVNPVGMFINRRLHAWVSAGSLRQYFHLYCIYLAGIAAIAAVACWILAASGTVELHMAPAWFALLVAASIFFNTINQTLVPSLNMVGRVKPFIALTIATLAIGLLVAFTLVKTFGASAQLWLAGPLVSQAIFAGIAYQVFFKAGDKSQPFPTKTNYGQVLKFCWPIAIAVGLNWLHMQGYRFLLAEYFQLSDLGLFSAGYGLAASLTAAIESVCTTWFQPKFYRDSNSEYEEVRSDAWVQYLRAMLPLSMLALAGIVATSPYLTKIMLGPAYQTSSQFVIAGAFAEWVRTLCNMFALNAHQKMKTNVLIIPSALGVVVAYAGLMLVLKVHDLALAPMAVAAGGVVMCASLYMGARTTGPTMRTLWVETFRSAMLAVGLLLVYLALVRPAIAALGPWEPVVGMGVGTFMWTVAAWLVLRRPAPAIFTGNRN